MRQRVMETLHPNWTFLRSHSGVLARWSKTCVISVINDRCLVFSCILLIMLLTPPKLDLSAVCHIFDQSPLWLLHVTEISYCCLVQVTRSLSSQHQLEAIEKVTNVKTDVKSVTGKSNTCVKEGLFIREVCSSLTQRVSLGAEHQLLFQVLVSLGKLHDGEEKSKEGDIDIGVHDEDGAL